MTDFPEKSLPNPTMEWLHAAANKQRRDIKQLQTAAHVTPWVSPTFINDWAGTLQYRYNFKKWNIEYRGHLDHTDAMKSTDAFIVGTAFLPQSDQTDISVMTDNEPARLSLNHETGSVTVDWPIISIVYKVKLWSDRSPYRPGTPFTFDIDEDADGATLVMVKGSVSVAGTAIEMSVTNNTTGYSMLSTNVTIDSGEKSSDTAAIAPVIDPTHAVVHDGDELSLDVVDGGGAYGHMIRLKFARV